jgi:hypothetical protein
MRVHRLSNALFSKLLSSGILSNVVATTSCGMRLTQPYA